MRDWRNVGLVIGIAAMVMSLTGCAIGGATKDQSATAGMEFSLFYRDATGAEVLYQVDRAGNLSFSGGMAARLERVQWTGPLTPEEIAQLRSLFAAHNWFEKKPESTNEPEGAMYRLDLHSPENRTRFTVKGESEELKPIADLLATASRRRLAEDLKALPQPGKQQ